MFLTAVFLIVWLAGSLFAEDIKKLRATERRLARVPVTLRVR
jgi:hypothetical protein